MVSLKQIFFFFFKKKKKKKTPLENFSLPLHLTEAKNGKG